MTTPANPVKNNLGWGIAGFLLFWPVGLFALIKAIKVNGLVTAGDNAGAEAASVSAKKLGKIAVIIGLVLVVLVCGFYGIIAAFVLSADPSVAM